MTEIHEKIRSRIEGLTAKNQRTILGICGAPGAGKSTLAELLAATFKPVAVVVPMDGFHLSNSELKRLERCNRKGAPDTFDRVGFLTLIKRLRLQAEETVYAPRFCRELDEPIAGSIPVLPSQTLVIVEGNYLLCDGIWAEARSFFDETWFVATEETKRHEWLKARHMLYGRDEKAAREWIQKTDAPNATLVRSTMNKANFIITPSDVLPEYGRLIVEPIT